MSNTFGQNVRARRLELGMTLQEVADELNHTPQYVSRWEGGEYGTPRASTIASFAKALDVAIVVKTRTSSTNLGKTETKTVTTFLTSPKESVS